MLNFIQNLDLAVLTWINNLPHPDFLVALARFFTDIGSWGIVWLVVGLFFAFLGRKKGVRTFWLIATALVMDIALNEYLIKLTINRPRPYNDIVTAGLYFWDTHWVDSSFVSGHSFTAIACAIIIGSRHPKWIWPFLILALLITFSRVYLGSHWPSDVLVGAILGMIIGYIIIFVESKYFVREKEIKQKSKKTKK